MGEACTRGIDRGDGRTPGATHDRHSCPRPCLGTLPRRPRARGPHRPPHPAGPCLRARPQQWPRPLSPPSSARMWPLPSCSSSPSCASCDPAWTATASPPGSAIASPGVALLVRPGAWDRGAMLVLWRLHWAADHSTIGPQNVVPSVALVPKAWSYARAPFHTGKRGVGATMELLFILITGPRALRRHTLCPFPLFPDIRAGRGTLALVRYPRRRASSTVARTQKTARGCDMERHLRQTGKRRNSH